MRWRPNLLYLSGAYSVLLLSLCALAAQTAGSDPASWSDAKREQFLGTAEILESAALPMGVTQSSRITLSDGLLTHDAHLQTVDIYKKSFRTRERTIFNFRDNYRYNIAAYRLDRLLDLGMVPVSVERTVNRKPAAVTWWVDDTMMSLAERHSRRAVPPDIPLWNDQTFQGRIFTQLIHNTDAHLNNHLIDADWKLWMIDFTRAFRSFKKLHNPTSLGTIDRRVLTSLRGLTAESLDQETDRYLSQRERRAILARRDLLLEYFDAKIEAEGEAAVVCDRPGH